MTTTITISVHPSVMDEWNLFKRRSAGGYGVSRAIMELIREDNARFRKSREVSND